MGKLVSSVVCECCNGSGSSKDGRRFCSCCGGSGYMVSDNSKVKDFVCPGIKREIYFNKPVSPYKVFGIDRATVYMPMDMLKLIASDLGGCDIMLEVYVDDKFVGPFRDFYSVVRQNYFDDRYNPNAIVFENKTISSDYSTEQSFMGSPKLMLWSIK